MKYGIIGVLTAAAVFFTLLLGQEAKPIKEASDVLSPAHDFCHSGWKADEVRTQGVVSLTCEKEGVTVILDGTGRFNIAHLPNGRFTENEADVPGW